MLNPGLHNAHLAGDTFLWDAGPVGVLLLHGYTATTAEVRLLGKVLCERGYTVFGPLLPGHGTTIQELNRCVWQDWVTAAERAYALLAGRCEKVFVGGESMGGLLALYLASQHADIPGVMTYAAAIQLPPNPQLPFVPLMAHLAPFVERVPEPPCAADARWKGYPVNPLPALVQLLRLQHAVRERLSAITQPALIVQGDLDTAVDASGPDIIAAGISSQRKSVHRLAHSTHCLLLDQEWEHAAALTLAFMEEVLQSEDTP